MSIKEVSKSTTSNGIDWG